MTALYVIGVAAVIFFLTPAVVVFSLLTIDVWQCLIIEPLADWWKGR